MKLRETARNACMYILSNAAQCDNRGRAAQKLFIHLFSRSMHREVRVYSSEYDKNMKNVSMLLCLELV